MAILCVLHLQHDEKANCYSVAFFGQLFLESNNGLWEVKSSSLRQTYAIEERVVYFIYQELCVIICFL
jgi:hypothetical protein